MQISKVKLVNGGFKGIEVYYMKVEEKGGFHFNNEHTSKFKSPINSELQNAFKELRKHLRTICSLNPKVDEEQIEVTGLVYNGESFLITAKLNVLDNQTIAINTPLIDAETSYKEYERVIEVCDHIYQEVVDYIEKKKMMAPKQYAMDFASKVEKRSDLTEIEAMSEEEATAFMKDALQKKGCLIMSPEDFSTEEPETVEVEEDNFGAEEGLRKVV